MSSFLPIFPTPYPQPPLPVDDPWQPCSDRLPNTGSPLPGESVSIADFRLQGNQLQLVLTDGQLFTVTLPQTNASSVSRHEDLTELYPLPATGADLWHLSLADYTKVQNLINPFKNPFIALSTFPFQKKGTSYTATVSGSVNPQDGLITGRELYRNGVLWQQPTGNSFSYVDTPATVDVLYRLRVNYSNVARQELERRLQFITPLYAGVGEANLTASGISALSEILAVKGDRSVTYTATNQRMYYAYEKSYGVLRKITNPSGFDITLSFIRYEVSISFAGYSPVALYVYMSDAELTNPSYKVLFEY